MIESEKRNLFALFCFFCILRYILFHLLIRNKLKRVYSLLLWIICSNFALENKKRENINIFQGKIEYL